MNHSEHFTMTNIVLGYTLWSFSEVLIHKYIFHSKVLPKTVTYWIHGIHHENQEIIEIPLPINIALLYILYCLVIPISIFATWFLAYFIYECYHMAMHNVDDLKTWGLLNDNVEKLLMNPYKEHHMLHHKRPMKNFAVSPGGYIVEKLFFENDVITSTVSTI